MRKAPEAAQPAQPVPRLSLDTAVQIFPGGAFLCKASDNSPRCLSTPPGRRLMQAGGSASSPTSAAYSFPVVSGIVSFGTAAATQGASAVSPVA